MLIEFGFERENCRLALWLRNNDIEQAVELLTSDEGSSLEALNALAGQKRQAEAA